MEGERRQQGDETRKPSEAERYVVHFNAWIDKQRAAIERLEDLSDIDSLSYREAFMAGARAIYLASVSDAVTYFQGLPPEEQTPMTSRDLFFGHLEEEGVGNEDLDMIKERVGFCAVTTAREWLGQHPESESAQAVSQLGLDARFRHHMGLMLEIYGEDCRREGLSFSGPTSSPQSPKA